MDLHGEARRRLREIDQRYTPGRRSIVDALAETGRPLTVPELVAESGIPSSSAYRNVLVLVEAGVLHRVTGADDHARFELAEPFGEHHHHLICDNCGTVVDIDASRSLERALDAAAKIIAADTGLEIRAHRIDLLGRCTDCV
jgi:Fur family ferric uptake transcriptional regulator